MIPARLAALAAVFFGLNLATKAFIAIREFSPNAFSLPVFDRSGQPWWFLGRLALCSAQDAAVVLAVLWLGLLLARRMPRAALFGAYALSTLALVLAVANIQVFHVYQRFLDPSLLAMAQFGGHGYFDEYAPAWFVAMLVGAPIAVVAAERWFVRHWGPDWDAVARRLSAPATTLAAVAVLWGVSAWTQTRVLNEAYAPFAGSAHWALVRDAVWPATATGGDCGADLADFATGQARPGAAGARKLNLIVVVWDGVAAKYLSSYGDRQGVTPELARLADRSTVFENFYSNAAISAPSLLTVFASVMNAPHAYVTHLSYPKYPLPHGPGWLREHGWRGYFVGDDGWGEGLSSFYLKDRFDVSMDSDRVYHDGGKPRTRPRFHRPEDSQRVLSGYLDEAQAPFVAMHWTGAAHPPFWPGDGPMFDPALFPASARAREQENHRNFLRALWRADQRLGELVRELERRGLSENTVIALTADHGHGWGEHGYWSYGDGLYDELVRVPLILIGAPVKPLPRRVAPVGGHADLWPTLAAVVGAPPHAGWQGRNLLEPGPERRAYFACIGQLGVREGRYKLIWRLGGRQEKLFDLEADPGELTDVAERHPDVAARLRCQLVAWAREQRRHFEERSK